MNKAIKCLVTVFVTATSFQAYAGNPNYVAKCTMYASYTTTKEAAYLTSAHGAYLKSAFGQRKIFKIENKNGVFISSSTYPTPVMYETYNVTLDPGKVYSVDNRILKGTMSPISTVGTSTTQAETIISVDGIQIAKCVNKNNLSVM